MTFERTIGRAVEASGVGLHSGAPVSIRLLPAPPGTGIVFLRKDLDHFPVPATWRHVAKVSYATSLMRQGVLISTTEHLLSVFYSMGIDNAFVEIDNLEVPILDGSGLPFVRMVRQAGIVTQGRRRQYLKILKPVTVRDGHRSVSILPADTFHLSCKVFFDHPLIGEQRLDLEVTPESFQAEIAPARTFGFAHELDRMRDMGLIRGASLENAVCYDQKEVLNPGGLRFPDECVRHKALDLIGDLALLGRPLLGHVVAERAGHAMHVALVARIMADASTYELVTIEQLPEKAAAALLS